MTPATEKPPVLISRLLPEPAVTLARSRASVDAYDQDAPMPRGELLKRLADRQGLVCVISEVIDQALLDACPKLRVVSNVAVGYNNVDVAACTKRGVVVTNTPDVLTDTTAHFAWTLLVAPPRRLAEADRYVREGRFKQWEYMLQLGGDVHGKTLGVVGFGRIGRAMARRALGFGMRVLYQGGGGGGRWCDRARAEGLPGRPLHAPARIGLRDAPYSAHPRDPTPHEPRDAPRHEEDRVPDQRGPRPGGGRGRAGRGPPRGLDR